MINDDVTPIVMWFLTAIALVVVIVGEVKTMNAVDECIQAELSKAEVVWQEDRPFCMVKAELNGNIVYIDAEDYNNIGNSK